MTSTTAGWRLLEEVFGQALELQGAERDIYLAAACAGRPELRSEVESLLEADRDPSGILDGCAAEALERADAEAWIGRHAGPYRLLEIAGRGGMATVYRAERTDGELERTVAVKVLPWPAADGASRRADLLRRFRAERQTLAALAHPNIVSILDAGSLEDGRPFLVMEWVEGRSLDAACDDPPMALDDRLRLFEAICRAVHHAHQRLVVHRDLKPSNILVTAEGTPKLLDFGIAELLDGRAAETLHPGARALDGRAPHRLSPRTPAYASPEQIRGEPVSTASDVYALGLVLRRLLVGRDLHPATASAEEIERTALAGPPPAPSATPGLDAVRRRRLRGDLDAIALQALDPEPNARYSSALALARDLERHRRHLPVQARPSGLPYRLGKLWRRRRWAVVASLLATAALLAAGVQAHLGRQRAEAGERIAWRAHADAVYVTEYLASVLERAGSGELEDRASVLAVLQEAEERIAEDLGSAPEAEGRMRHAVGRVYLRLGLTEKAAAHARRALELSRNTRGLSWTDESRNLDLLARSARAQGEDASSWLQARLALHLARLGAEHAATLMARARLAGELRRRGRVQEALAEARTAAEGLRGESGIAPEEAREIVEELIACLRAAGRAEEAATWEAQAR